MAASTALKVLPVVSSGYCKPSPGIYALMWSSCIASWAEAKSLTHGWGMSGGRYRMHHGVPACWLRLPSTYQGAKCRWLGRVLHGAGGQGCSWGTSPPLSPQSCGPKCCRCRAGLGGAPARRRLRDHLLPVGDGVRWECALQDTLACTAANRQDLLHCCALVKDKTMVSKGKQSSGKR